MSQKIEKLIIGLTSTMIGHFDDVHEDLDEIKFNTSNQDRRISRLEDDVRRIKTKIDLK